jgi:hypothetical protein
MVKNINNRYKYDVKKLNKKELLLNKIALFKENFPDYQISKKGNLYSKVFTVEEEVKYQRVNALNINIDNYRKIFSKDNIKTVKIQKSTIVLLNVNIGKLYYKYYLSDNYIPMNIKSFCKNKLIINNTTKKVVKKICNVLFFNKTYEYLKDYPELTNNHLFFCFKSIEEVSDFLKIKYKNIDDFLYFLRNISFKELLGLILFNNINTRQFIYEYFFRKKNIFNSYFFVVEILSYVYDNNLQNEFNIRSESDFKTIYSFLNINEKEVINESI